MSGELLLAQLKKAETMAASSILPKDYQRNPANILVAMEAADALGVTLFQAIQMVTVINGRMTMSAEGMRGLVLSRGHLFRVEEESAQAARVAVARRERPSEVQTFTFTADDAKRAGLTGGNYAKYPAAMLLARATTKACRAVFPDVIAGISYTPDEVVEFTTAAAAPRPEPQPDAPVLPEGERPVAADWDALEAAFTDLAAVTGKEVPPYPQQARTISTLLGRTVTTFKQLSRADVAEVVRLLGEQTVSAAEDQFAAADVIDAELVEPEEAEQ